ncbi:MAG: glucose-1-phosphate thymidylyltransferase [Ignavibacteriales bacterium]|nr:MAG: glucose-1-phosphate thymidylyltransferase [Ignavibacteriales bacterium]
MNTTICIFEDAKFKNFLPLTYFRPVYDLRCGVLTIAEKIEKYSQTSNIILHSRKYLANYLREEKKAYKINSFDASHILFINGRLLPSADIFEILISQDEDEVFINNNDIIAARLSNENISLLIENNKDFLSDFSKLKCRQTEIDAYLFEYPWHLIQKNGEEIINDIALISIKKNENDFSGVHFIKEENIFIGENVTIKPNVVLDASEGPIYIDDEVTIFPNTYIVGPSYIGKRSIVKANSQIYHNTTIGPVCKVGGEIENSIIHSYSNKQHEGFLGHAYLGSWINIGASSNNSDLKNDYSRIKVMLNGHEVDTGTNFMGLIMGDHSKCAINTAFNTGTVIGVSCNIYGSGFPPKYIPSFSWGGADGFREYHLRKAIEVAKIVKSRRNITMSVNDLELFKSVFDLTQSERT